MVLPFGACFLPPFELFPILHLKSACNLETLSHFTELGLDNVHKTFEDPSFKNQVQF